MRRSETHYPVLLTVLFLSFLLSRFVIANDVFKFKEFNLDSKQCRRTSLAPRFGNPVITLLPIPPDPSAAVAEAPEQEPARLEDPATQADAEGNAVDPALLPDESEPQQMRQAKPAPVSPMPEYFAFATDTRVIGLSSFPLTGDPSQVGRTQSVLVYRTFTCTHIQYARILSQAMGIVAHPGEVTCVAVSHDGRYIFSAGGFDLSVNMWRVDVEEHRREKRAAQLLIAAAEEEAATAVAAGDDGAAAPAGAKAVQEAAALRPYFSLLEGGEGGELHRDIVDYFYYCQLRHLGEDSMETRNLTGEIPLDEIPSLFRSVGYYPSEDEVLNIINEVRYKNFVNTGETQEYVGLVRSPTSAVAQCVTLCSLNSLNLRVTVLQSELIRLYINHRPALPLDQHLITAAFDSISDR